MDIVIFNKVLYCTVEESSFQDTYIGKLHAAKAGPYVKSLARKDLGQSEGIWMEVCSLPGCPKCSMSTFRRRLTK